MEFIKFFLANKRLISFGFLMTFFSSFGQTFLISLYVPAIMSEFNLNTFSFGMIYGTATVLSGITLVYAGKFIDEWNLRDYTLAAVFLLITSCLLIVFSRSLIFVFIGLWGLRLSGPGLLTHISSTSISKLFNKTRGMALSLSILGYSVGEAFLPITVGLTIGLVGWRNSILLNAAAIGIILIPFVYTALNRKFRNYYSQSTNTHDKAGFKRSRLFRNSRFYIIAFNTIMLPSIATGLFFYHLILAEEKGWSVELIASSFMGFAAGKTVFSLLGGKLIDRFSALTIFPLYLIPFGAALCIAGILKNNFAAPVYLMLTGVSAGLHNTVNTALLAEIYGTSNLGSVRSVFATVIVLSTALSPALFGFLLNKGLSFTFINTGAAGLVFVAILVSSRLWFIGRPLKHGSYTGADTRTLGTEKLI